MATTTGSGDSAGSGSSTAAWIHQAPTSTGGAPSSAPNNTDWASIQLYTDDYWFASDSQAPLDYMIWVTAPDGSRVQISYQQLIQEGLVEKRLSIFELHNLNISGEIQGILDGLYSGGGGGYSGGGAVGPVYQKPDERLVREGVKGMLASLAGTVDEAQLDSLVKIYMDEDQRSFAVRETEQVDPMESVKEAIRGTSEYKTIHQLRPESTDEYTWITQRQGALTRAGVSDATAESLGVAQAQAGSSDQETVMAGNIATFNKSGQQLDELKNRIYQATYGVLELV